MTERIELLRKFLDKVPAVPCAIKPEPAFCSICEKINKRVAEICKSIPRVVVEKPKHAKAVFEEPMIEVIKRKPEVEKVVTLEPVPEVEVLEPVPELKMEKRLEGLKVARERKSCFGLSLAPYIGSALLFLLGVWLYNTTSETIQIVPDWLAQLTAYNISCYIGVLWLALGIVLTACAARKQVSFSTASFLAGLIGVIIGALFLGLGVYLYLAIEVYVGGFAPYNILFLVGVISIVYSLIVLCIRQRIKRKKINSGFGDIG